MKTTFERALVWCVLGGVLGGCSASSLWVPDAGRGDGGGVVEGGIRPDVLVGMDGGGPAVCVFPDGRTCPVGAACRAPDGCNTCTCSPDGTLACTEIACPDGGPPEAGSTRCFSGSQCANGQACNFTTPGCGVPGMCGPIADCPATRSFCGCDGQTFNDCVPSRPWVSQGMCSTTVFCSTSAECGRGQGCVFSAGCGTRGTCRPLVMCDRPISYCGCGGNTFSACPGQATQPYRSEGACRVDGGMEGGTAACRTSADCTGGQVCLYPQGCGMPGLCVPTPPPICALPNGYCGCDGRTYNDCLPTRPWASEGPCGIPTMDASVEAGTTGCRLPNGSVCPFGRTCPAGDGCNTCVCSPMGSLACTRIACVDAGVACPATAMLNTIGRCVDSRTNMEAPVQCCRGYVCDQRRAACDAIPPTCAPGFTPSVVGACWGPCVPNANCSPIPCDPTMPAGCPSGFACNPATRTCLSR